VFVNLYLERCETRREELRADAETILTVAAQENREVTDSERSSVEGMYREIQHLDGQIAPLHDAEMRNAQHAKSVAELQRTVAARRDEPQPHGQLERYRNNVGAWLADWGQQKSDPHAAQRIARAGAEWRVVADQKLADNPGIVPIPIVGDVVGTLPTARPFVDSVTSRPMPSGGSTFNRPRITQHALVGVQATEKTQLASQKLVIGSTPVTKKTFGGTLDISFQDRDWTDPAILGIAVADMAGVYAQETDNAAADGMLAATTGTFVLADAATDGATRAAIMSASSQILANTKRYPDTVWMSPDEYAKFGAMTNTAGGQVSFPGLQDATGFGGNLMGLKVVVDGNFAAKTMIIGTSGLVEHYETVGGLLSVTEPTILGYTIAYYGYVADLLVDVGSALKRSPT
jgi:HK97 family phage major capsid protein